MLAMTGLPSGSDHREARGPGLLSSATPDPSFGGSVNSATASATPKTSCQLTDQAPRDRCLRE